jgi:hypothetical protein
MVLCWNNENQTKSTLPQRLLALRESNAEQRVTMVTIRLVNMFRPLRRPIGQGSNPSTCRFQQLLDLRGGGNLRGTVFWSRMFVASIATKLVPREGNH